MVGFADGSTEWLVTDVSLLGILGDGVAGTTSAAGVLAVDGIGDEVEGLMLRIGRGVLAGGLVRVAEAALICRFFTVGV